MSSRQPVALSSRPPDSAAPGRRGRRPSGSDTRGEIVAAARGEFSAQGYDATSLRAVARRAGVDSALVHHYFAGKPALFAEVMELPLDPVVLVAAIVAAPRDEVGATLVRSFFTVWDDAEGRERFQGVIRSALTHEAAARMIREFLTEEAFARVARELGDGDPEANLRGGLVGSQMVGLAMMRYVLGFQPIVDASVEDLVRLVGPTIQRYLLP